MASTEAAAAEVTNGGAAPEKLKRVAKPDQEKLDATIRRIEAEIQKLDSEVHDVERRITERMDASKASRALSQEARTRFHEIREEQNRVRAEKDALLAQLTALRGPRASAGGAGAGAGAAAKPPRARKIEDIDEEIQRLEYRQRSETLSLAEEKNLVKQIVDARNARAAVKSLHAAEEQSKKDRAAQEEVRQSISEQLDAKKEELKAVGARVDAQRKILDAFGASTDTGVGDLMQRSRELKKQISEKRNSIKAAKTEFYDQKRAFFDYMQEQRRIRDEEYKKRREAEAAMEAAAAEVVEEQNGEEKPHPWSDELWMCDMLTTFFSKLKPAVAVEKRDEGVKEVAEEFKGVRLAKKGIRDADEDDYDYLSGAASKSKAKKAAPKPQKVRPFTHDFETLSMFQRLGLTAPSTPADVEATLEALQQKKAYFTTLPPKETKADKKSSPTKGAGAGTGRGAGAGAAAAAAGKTVSTPYGPAKVQSRRADGVVVVKMAAFDALAYLQSNQITSA